MSTEQNANNNQSQSNNDGGGSGGGGNGDEGNNNQAGNAFLESLPEAVRGFEGLKEITDAGMLADKYVNLVKAQPMVPEKPEAYQITVPDGVPRDEAFLSGFRTIAHQAKLTQDQVKAITDFWASNLGEALVQRDKARETAVKTLRSEWKGDYDQNLAQAKDTLKKFGGEEMIALMEESGLGNSPVMVKVFHAIGQAISEDSFVAGNQNKPKDVKRTTGGEPMLTFPSMEKK
jgi:hypothetical protein